MVEIEDNLPLRVTGDRTNPLYGGYTCIKGRSLPKIHANPARVLHSLEKDAAGRRQAIEVNAAIDEIAARLSALIEQHGPRSVAFWFASAQNASSITYSVARAFANAVQTPMIFSVQTLDQPGLIIGRTLHGEWGGGEVRAADADAALVIGANPVISHQYLSQNPARRLKDSVNDGMKLIVVDPRSSETARRAHVHLQPRPGTDVAVIAGIIHLLIASDKVDREFLALNAKGFDSLARAVAPFTPERVARHAGLDAQAIIDAAHILGEAKMGYVAGGTGISMSGHGNLCFYLLRCLQTVRGFWPRAGTRVAGPSVLLPPTMPPTAQPLPLKPLFGDERLRVRNLKQSVVGMPASGLPDEILLDGPGQVRALIALGNPASSWPDTERARRALAKLDLLIVPTVEMSETADLANYVIAIKTILETPATTQFAEQVRKVHHGYGWDEGYAHHTPVLLNAPSGSDLIEEWQFFFRLAQRMGLQLQIPGADGGMRPVDMTREPTSEEMIDLLCEGSVVPLGVVRDARAGRVYAEADRIIGSRDPSCSDRLNLGDSLMMAELVRYAPTLEASPSDIAFPFRLTPRRSDGVVNSMYRRTPGMHKRHDNPAFMAPADLERLHIQPGTPIRISSPHGEIIAIAEAGAGLRPGVVSMSHGYGAMPGEDEDPSRGGANVNRLLRMDELHDSISGIPLMGAVPVAIEPAEMTTE
ncbi:molybdopterin-containing oxidoreductase family protein [Sphingobium phenoxybenzoativorans]|uniref:molybdopterin-containing oxidoreductase family protein n=1 Tax=Sphingobium phenoxybenzoativorans TaxID=1592790 RepID=UPI0014961B58|nr:molybdopterin-dependent oxidoreductase [Sphingobium phenoxybenzoativorans]